LVCIGLNIVFVPCGNALSHVPTRGFCTTRELCASVHGDMAAQHQKSWRATGLLFLFVLTSFCFLCRSTIRLSTLMLPLASDCQDFYTIVGCTRQASLVVGLSKGAQTNRRSGLGGCVVLAFTEVCLLHCCFTVRPRELAWL
jgi:hypothetical protein